MPRLLGLTFILFALASCAAGPSARADLSWEVVPGKSVALLRTTATGKEPVWQFHCGDERHKPCFHPLALPGNRVLTLDMPSDHRWHHGLWFSWKFIDGVNYWENDSKTGKPVGQTAWQLLDTVTRPDGTALLRLHVEYGPQDAPVLEELRELQVSAPAADGTFFIDWRADFRALAACTLNRTPLPGQPGGRANGGYAGLGARLALLDERQAHTIDGPVVFNAQNRFRTHTPAFDYSGVLDGRAVGLTILAHSETVRSPSPWYAIAAPQMAFFMPAVICDSPMVLQPRDTFVLRYRAIVHHGRMTSPELAAAVAAYESPTNR